MNNKLLVLAALGVSVQGAATFLKNAAWPKYESVSGVAANTALHAEGYGCIRGNFYYGFP